ncbi:hypothetical protein DFS33DRAFT_110242 [Desarmillaria ectypa]|nr:hypothetical protein DFS33DRAFT_110242 [Desarmillaria ectypa]
MCKTGANARREAKANTTEEWRKMSEASRKRGQYATANRLPPSLKPSCHLQCRTGQGYIGEFYAQFVPSEDVDCPCSELFQTREHIIRECPLYDAERETLRKVSRSIYLLDILGTKDGITVLGEFIEKSGTFTRSGEP